MDITNYNQKNTSITKDTSYVLMSVKAEKITAALYMVTDCMEETEPMKERLRAIGVRFLTLGSICRGGTVTDAQDAGAEIEILALEAMAIIDVATLVGIISDMNGTILKTELKRLSEMAAGARPVFSAVGSESKHTAIMLPENFFAEDISSDTSGSFIPSEISKGHGYKGHTNAVSFINDPSSAAKKAETIIQKTQSKKYDVAQKINRRNSILELIKDKREVSIKDITTVIADISEKTVQRELGVLVEQGVLKRTGEKRWSKYSLI